MLRVSAGIRSRVGGGRTLDESTAALEPSTKVTVIFFYLYSRIYVGGGGSKSQ